MIDLPVYGRVDTGGLGRTARILMVEDNAADSMLLQRFLIGTGANLQLTIIEDGEEASNYLARSGRFADCHPPDLVLLDLNLPRKGGMELLRDIKKDPVLRHLPVIILSSSASAIDVNRAYSSGANLYWRKPGTLQEVERMTQTLVEVWLHFALLPSSPGLPPPFMAEPSDSVKGRRT